MGNFINTAPCRFCGQMVQIEADGKLTQPQAEEKATMSCTCPEAVEYQKEKQRKEKALKNVSVLFGEDAAPEKRIGEDIVNILRAAVEEIYSGGLAKVTLNLRGGELKPQFHRIARVSITGVVFSWEGYDLFPCVDGDGVPDNEKMEIVKSMDVKRKIYIFQLDEYSWYAAHSIMEFLNWYHENIDSIEIPEDVAGITMIEPEDGQMWSNMNITQEDVDALGDNDECCRGGIGDLKKMQDGEIFKMQTFADVLGDEDIKEPYEIASTEY